MNASSVNEAIDFDPFQPAHLCMKDGSRITLSCPYLSFVLRDSLYAADVGDFPRRGPALIPLETIASVMSDAPGVIGSWFRT